MTTGRWMRSALGFTAAAALVITALAAPAGAAQGGVTVKPDVTYRTVDGEQLGLDVYRSAKKGKTRPAVVVVHGGGWSQGDKALFAQQSNQLAERGFVAFSINYRLAPAHPYPAAVQDVEAAVAWVRKHAKEYGVDPARIGALGGAGGGPPPAHARPDRGGAAQNRASGRAGGGGVGPAGPLRARPPAPA